MSVKGRIVVAVAIAGALVGAACKAPVPVVSGPGGGSGGAVTTPGPSLGGCPMFPADNAWNQKVSSLRVRPDSNTLIANISSAGKTNLHPDFGGAGAYGNCFLGGSSTRGWGVG